MLLHDKRHPAKMREAEVRRFLTHLAVDHKLATSSQNHALNALAFRYKAMLDRPRGNISEVVRAKKPQRLPEVLTRDEVRRQVLRHLDGSQGVAVCLRNVTFSLYTSPSEPIWTEPTEGYADIAVRPAAKALSTDRRDADGTAPRGCGRRV